MDNSEDDTLIPVPNLQSVTSPRTLIPLRREWYLEAKIRTLSMLTVLGTAAQILSGQNDSVLYDVYRLC